MTALDAFADAARWVAWRNEARGPNGDLTKVPYGARGRRASAKDPTTWIHRAEADSRAIGLANGTGGGIGIELGDLGADLHLAGLDLDSCVDERGCLAPWAEQILVELPTYAETSPSGKGLKAFFCLASKDVRRFLDLLGVAAEQWGTKRGILGYNGGNHGPGVELYTSHRFFAVTERLFPGRPEQIATLGWEQLERLAALIPAPTENKDRRGAGRDNSRSAKAFRRPEATRRR